MRAITIAIFIQARLAKTKVRFSDSDFEVIMGVYKQSSEYAR